MKKFPRFNPNKALGIILLLGIAFSVITIVMAVAPNPGHNFAEVSGNVVQGDLLYGSATDVLSALAKNITATRYLSNTGASNNPAWAQVDLTNGVTGILPAGNGGTGNAFFTVSGPATSIKTFTFPNVSATVLTTNAAVTVGQGGTGLTATADDAVWVGDSTSAVTARALPSCSGATTDKLLYNISTNSFSCGTDQTGGGGGGFPTAILASDLESLSSTVYTTIFTIPMTVSRTNVISAILAQSTSLATIGIQTRGRVTASAHTGFCSFVRQSAAAADANIDNIAVTTGPADTAQTAEFSTLAARTEVICTVVATAAAGDLVLEFQSETGGSVKTLGGSYYMKVVAP